MKTQIKSILVPTDFSVLSESALKVGIAIAKRQEAVITLLHVVNIYSQYGTPEVLLQETGKTPDNIMIMSDKIMEIAADIQKRSGVRTIGKLLSGIAADSICQFASEKDAC